MTVETLLDVWASLFVITVTAAVGYCVLSLVALGIKVFRKWRKDVNRC